MPRPVGSPKPWCPESELLPNFFHLSHSSLQGTAMPGTRPPKRLPSDTAHGSRAPCEAAQPSALPAQHRCEPAPAGRKGVIKLQMEELLFFYESISHMADGRHRADDSGTAVPWLSRDTAPHCDRAALLSSLAPGDIAQQRRTCLKHYTSPGTGI